MIEKKVNFSRHLWVVFTSFALVLGISSVQFGAYKTPRDAVFASEVTTVCHNLDHECDMAALNGNYCCFEYEPNSSVMDFVCKCKMNSENKIHFSSYDEAIKAGCRACGKCRPQFAQTKITLLTNMG